MPTYPVPPTSRSFLSNNKFEFVLNRIPNLTFYVQGINLPGITLTSTIVTSPTTALSIPGNIISFSEIQLSFIVDEDMQSWYEIYDWMWQLGNPEGFDKRGTLDGPVGSSTDIFCDGSLVIKTNSNNPNKKITFHHMYPTDLAELTFTTVDTGQDFITSGATFAYSYYEFSEA